VSGKLRTVKMSEKRQRKTHSAEFKAKVGLEALRGVKTLNEIGQEYGVHPIQVGIGRRPSRTRLRACSRRSVGRSPS